MSTPYLWMQLLTRMYCHSQVTTLGSAVLAKGGQRELHSAPFLGHSTLVSRLRLSAVSLFMIPWLPPVSMLLCGYLTTSKATGTVKSFSVPEGRSCAMYVFIHTLSLGGPWACKGSCIWNKEKTIHWWGHSMWTETHRAKLGFFLRATFRWHRFCFRWDQGTEPTPDRLIGHFRGPSGCYASVAFQSI